MKTKIQEPHQRLVTLILKAPAINNVYIGIYNILTFYFELQNELKFSKAILEHNEFWLQQKVGDIDKNLKFCIDQM